MDDTVQKLFLLLFNIWFFYTLTNSYAIAISHSFDALNHVLPEKIYILFCLWHKALLTRKRNENHLEVISRTKHSIQYTVKSRARESKCSVYVFCAPACSKSTFLCLSRAIFFHSSPSVMYIYSIKVLNDLLYSFSQTKVASIWMR